MSILILIAFVIMIISYQILQQFHKEVIKQAGKQSSEIFPFNFNQSKLNELYNSYKKGIRKEWGFRGRWCKRCLTTNDVWGKLKKLCQEDQD